jgi:hypothetical protein
MGLLRRFFGLFSDDTQRETESGSRREVTASGGRGPDGSGGHQDESGDEPKQGGHGSHWDTVVAGNDEIQAAIMATVEEGEPSEGVDHVGYAAGAPVGALVVVAPSGQITTGYPVGEGVTHEFAVERRTVWANGHEAQFAGSLGPADVSFFPTNFYALDDEAGDTMEVSLAAFAYALGPVEDTKITDEDGETYDTAGMAALLPMEGGDVDDYSLQTTFKEVTECEFRGRTVYQLRVPLFRGEDGETDFDAYVYAGEHVLDGYVPAVGDDVAGAVWLQGRVEA